MVRTGMVVMNLPNDEIDVRGAGPSALQVYRGCLIGEWLRNAITDKRTGLMMKNADAARVAGVNASYFGVMLNNCFEASENRVKLPSDDILKKLAEKLYASFEDAKKRRYADLNAYHPSELQDEPAPTPGQIIRLLVDDMPEVAQRLVLRQVKEMKAFYEEEGKNVTLPSSLN